ncbi:MAG: FAD-dependent oxidoreductase [Candidatus Omnitrophota bacterium]
MKKYKFVILGAGLNGLSVAYELSKEHPGEVCVLEKEGQVGGMAKTIVRQDRCYDLGSHRIHAQVSREIFQYLEEFVGEDLISNVRGGRLRIKDKYIEYPIKPAQFFTTIGLRNLGSFIFSLIYNRCRGLLAAGRPDQGNTYEGYLRKQVGDRVYGLFYEPYAKKIFGLPPAEISITAVKKRMSLLSPFGFVKNMLVRHFVGAKPDRYYYFKNGIGELAQELECRLADRHVDIFKGVREFVLNGDKDIKEIRWLSLDGRQEVIRYEKLVSTIPVDVLCQKLAFKGCVDQNMWRGLRLVFLHINQAPALSGETFYFPELKYPFGRVSIPQRFFVGMQPAHGDVSYVCEVPCTQGDALWQMDDQALGRMCHQGLIEANLVTGSSRMNEGLNFTLKIPEVYSVYFLGWEERMQQMVDFLDQQYADIYTCGRLGLFLHCNIDHAIEMGQQLAAGLLRGMTSREWHARRHLFHEMKVRD